VDALCQAILKFFISIVQFIKIIAVVLH